MEQIKYKKGYKYQLHEDYKVIVGVLGQDVNTEYIRLSKEGELLIRKGYAWDGPSGPTFDTEAFMRGALVHDALYQLMREELIAQSFRLVADDELKRMCKEDGMSSFRAWYVYKSVRQFSSFATSPKNKKEILIAPR